MKRTFAFLHCASLLKCSPKANKKEDPTANPTMQKIKCSLLRETSRLGSVHIDSHVPLLPIPNRIVKVRFADDIRCLDG